VPTFSGTLGRIQSVLERKGQVILYGPPGTGKTYWGQRAARELAAQHGFGCAFGELREEQRHEVFGHEAQLGLVRAVTFHPAYGYEDFLEGYRPEVEGDEMVFARRDGIFKRLCRDAESAPDRRFYLLIDEINRGDIPRIFGELLTVLEKDKRDQTILLGVSGQPFRVPRNVYVIGTMNTADRSIALLDAALRRRFGFVELMPDSGVLGKASVGGVPLGRWLDALNARIREHAGRDARNLQIGHSYLLEGDQPIEQFVRFAQVLRDDIIPLLEEYTYEDYSALAKILGTGLVDTQHLRIHEEAFEPGRASELVQHLLGPNAEIVTAPEAVDAEPADEVGVESESDDEAGTAAGQ
jgi:5-methylcytosine-specific restriction protein B